MLQLIDYIGMTTPQYKVICLLCLQTHETFITWWVFVNLPFMWARVSTYMRVCGSVCTPAKDSQKLCDGMWNRIGRASFNDDLSTFIRNNMLWLNVQLNIQHCFFLRIADYACPSWVSKTGFPHLVFNGTCYISYSDKKNWRSSRDFCRSHGFELVSLNSREEQQSIDTWLLVTMGHSEWESVWMAGYKNGLGEWMWSDRNGGLWINWKLLSNNPLIL